MNQNDLYRRRILNAAVTSGAIDWSSPDPTHLQQVDANDITLGDLVKQPLLVVSCNGLAPRNGKGYVTDRERHIVHLDCDNGVFWVTDENGQELTEAAG